MIKELIIDIAYDKISVSQGLTRAKLIANQIKNETFKNWLSKELNGYEYEDNYLPKYRKIWAEIELLAEFSFGQTHRFPVVMPNSETQEMKDLVNFHQVREPISIIEQTLNDMEKSIAYIHLPSGMTEVISSLYKDQINSQGGVVRSGRRKIAKSQFQNIIELTKQKLIDTLQELDNQFPELENNYMPSENNKDKVNNIITNNIYGNNNPMNVAVGQNISQSDIVFNLTTAQKDKLNSFGVEDEHIQELESINKDNPKGTPDRKNKVFSWLGKVTASLASRGIYEYVPELTEFIGTII